MKEGLYYLDGRFVSRRDIELKYQDQPKFETPLPTGTDFDYWSSRFIARQQQYKETAEVQKDHVIISFPDTTLFNFLPDLHSGSPDTDYKRIEREVDIVVNTPHSYFIAMGDLVESMFFSNGQHEQMEAIPEQFSYMQALLEYLASRKKILAGWIGDHDAWVKKMGLSAYAEFSKKTGAYLMQGLGYITAKVGDIDYKFACAHRLPGHSMYTKTHPQKRAYKFGGAAGSDVVVSAHNHQKELSVTWEKSFGGETHPVYSIALGAYKCTDEYARKLGFAKQNPQEMYGASVRIEKGNKKITTYADIIEANREFH